ncbi:hypothetical protein TIFTF001_039784 [Ficus carica]|uniref:Uncharacterized protein n=1 Tax=Ficus carica TaxID=3494 RepID=A0AA87YP11_FICCA|nr:hypothetical protein TIFTF001_039781 [Ficus carica]GMN19323.1 hypothetical protein TIFTF001_039782 [Ficus carica]GMN19332.1 hypothetical protein TIFTF001_039783 [Ficus carica]GMN19339.1 hypothetical protein TIFTF001_039784 [Ficus carica]
MGVGMAVDGFHFVIDEIISRIIPRLVDRVAVVVEIEYRVLDRPDLGSRRSRVTNGGGELQIPKAEEWEFEGVTPIGLVSAKHRRPRRHSWCRSLCPGHESPTKELGCRG